MRQVFSDVLKKAVLPYAKAWASVAVFWVFGVLHSVGLEVPLDVQVSVQTAVTAFVVWLVPNIPYAKK